MDSPRPPIRRPRFTQDSLFGLLGHLIRNRRIFIRPQQQGCYLNLGCGKTPAAGFCNLDYYWHPKIDVCWDVTRGLPFADGYFGGIFSEHMLEHVDFDRALALLKECRRVLRPGGLLRLVVPDGELYLALYAAHLAGQPVRLPYAEDDQASFAFVTPMVSINRIFRFHGHQFIWDYETLRLALLHAGFSTVQKSSFGQSEDRRLICEQERRSVESLYVEAR